MQQKLIECVPNFSEGRDHNVIKQITNEIERVDGVRLLDVDPGAEMNRTVVTFVGDPEGVKKAAFNAIKKASELIDMRKQTGSHPRMGATDVCPFVPVNGVSIEECVQISKDVAAEVADKLKIPVFLYEKSAQTPDRTNLAVIRQGEYEGLAQKLKDPKWKPDYGAAEFNAQSGATVMGVREFLIAYNISLNTRESKYATDIAFELREKGRSARRGNIVPFYLKGEEIMKYEQGNYPCGDCSEFDGKTIAETVDHCRTVHNYDLENLLNMNGIDPGHPEGNSVKKAGMFTHCKAIGWMVPEYDRAQISINLTDYNVTNMHHVLEATRVMAAERGLVVTGSEIVGMVPYNALLDCGLYYLEKQERSRGIPVSDILLTAIQSLGLNDVAEFKMEDRVLGLPHSAKKALVEMKVSDFTDEVSRESPAPGGGSIAALAGALGAALTSMVSNLSVNKRGSESIDDILMPVAGKAQELKAALIYAVDADTDAFNAFMDAMRLPANNEADIKVRDEAMQAGLRQAVAVPLQTAKLSLEVIGIAKTAAEHGNPNSITDVGVGAQMGFAGVKGGVYNVLINLGQITDADFVSEMRASCKKLTDQAQKQLSDVAALVEKKIG